ncbi:MAG: DUF3093 domain-containing protein [Microthrixaceae bacterium]|nr:DUF3093 domain-containing protein [Microthrixaceae bacterium]
MQNYRERLTPSLWAFGAATVLAPMGALVLAPFDSTIGLIAGTALALLVILAMAGFATTISVQGTTLRAGRAHIDAKWLGTPEQLTGEDARNARGVGLDHRAWHVIRSGIDGAVRVPITDPDDPAPYWIISTRTPDRLAAAIQNARRDASN